jgi:hypothetical protein
MNESKSNWIEEMGDKSDVDLGDGHSLRWTTYNGKIVGGIIRHTAQNELGYCEASIWIRGNDFSKQHSPEAPQWDMTGDFLVPTFSPSFLCHCKDHGFIRNGKWERA